MTQMLEKRWKQLHRIVLNVQGTRISTRENKVDGTFEDTKRAIRNGQSKDRQYNGQKEKGQKDKQ